MFSDLFNSISEELDDIVNFIDNNKPKICYRKYRYCHKFKKSKKFFYRNYLYDYLLNNFCLTFAFRHIKKLL